MNESSQITFDFFTPPSAAVKKPVNTEKEAEPDQLESVKNQAEESSPPAEEIVEVIFPDPIAIPENAEQIPNPEINLESIEPVESITPGISIAKSNRGRKSLKSFALAADLVNIPEDDILFQKQYYSIGEVSEMFQVNASLLRFWESEFDIIQPRKNRKGDRHFRPVDIKNLQLIYDLLRRRKLTIEGAKDFIKRNSKAKERFETIQNLQKIRSFLAELKGSL